MSFNIAQLTHYLRQAYASGQPERIARWEAEIDKVNPKLRNSKELWAKLWDSNPTTGVALVAKGWKCSPEAITQQLINPPRHWYVDATPLELTHEENLLKLANQFKSLPDAAPEFANLAKRFPKESLNRWKVLVSKVNLTAPLKGGKGDSLLQTLAFTPSLKEHYLVGKEQILLTKSLKESERILGDIAFKTSPVSQSSTAQLRNTDGGWYHPETETVVPASNWSHNRLAFSNPTTPEALRNWHNTTTKALVKWQDEETNEFYEAVPEGEHPEGHIIDIWRSNQTHTFDELGKAYLFEAGWCKVAIFKDSGSIAIEGQQNTLTRYKDRIDTCVGALNVGRTHAFAEKRFVQTKSAQAMYASLHPSFKTQIEPYVPAPIMER